MTDTEVFLNLKCAKDCPFMTNGIRPCGLSYYDGEQPCVNNVDEISGMLEEGRFVIDTSLSHFRVDFYRTKASLVRNYEARLVATLHDGRFTPIVRGERG